MKQVIHPSQVSPSRASATGLKLQGESNLEFSNRGKECTALRKAPKGGGFIKKGNREHKQKSWEVELKKGEDGKGDVSPSFGLTKEMANKAGRNI